MSDYKLWDTPSHTLGVPDLDPVFCCEEARLFALWSEHLFMKLFPQSKPPTEAVLHHAFAQLAKRYWTAREVSTRGHRDRLYSSEGDPCVHGIFIETLSRLSQLTIQVPPTPVTRMPKTPVPVTPSLGGIFLGEIDDHSRGR